MEPKSGPIEITGKDSIWACTCMGSELWPMCDGSHHTFGGKGPVEIPLDPAKTYKICQCFKSNDKPFCDGSHLRK